MKVLVLDGNENQAVACVRSLARAGHQVVVGAETRWSKAGWSKYADRSFHYPAPQDDTQGFLQSLLSEAQKVPGTLILPMTERSTLPISANREALLAIGARLALPSHAAVLQAFDKEYTTRLADSLGIATPATFSLDSLEDATQVAARIRYPAVLKPRCSEEMSHNRRVRSTGRPLYANDKAELLDAYHAMRHRAKRILAQEFIEGSGAGFFALMNAGNPRAHFSHRRLRDVHPTGSGSSLRESVLPDKNLQEKSLQLLNALEWHGVAMVEFRLRRDGEPVFLEVNGRFWNSLPLAIHAGVDFPRLLAELVEKGDISPCEIYQTGVRCRWLLGDFRHLLSVLKGASKGFNGIFPNRLQTLAEFFTPVAGTYHDNFQLTDPLPELADWLDFFFRRIPQKFRQRSPQKENLNGKERYSHS